MGIQRKLKGDDVKVIKDLDKKRVKQEIPVFKIVLLKVM